MTETLPPEIIDVDIKDFTVTLALHFKGASEAKSLLNIDGIDLCLPHPYFDLLARRIEKDFDLDFFIERRIFDISPVLAARYENPPAPDWDSIRKDRLDAQA
jgi:hypothetical protein